MIAKGRHGVREALIETALRLRDHCAAREEDIRKQAKLSQAEFACLRAMPRDEGVASGELAQLMRLSASRGTRVVDALVRSGHLERRQSTTDRRVNLVHVTAAGRDVKDRIDGYIAQCERALRARLSDEEQRRAAAGMHLMLRALVGEETP